MNTTTESKSQSNNCLAYSRGRVVYYTKEDRTMNKFKAFRAGLVDGWRQPWDLTSGLTWDDERMNEIYDRGANWGQFLGRIFNRW